MHISLAYPPQPSISRLPILHLDSGAMDLDLLAFPVELQLCIVELLSVDDLRVLRQVCKHLDKLTRRYAFDYPVLRILRTRKDLDFLRFIASDEEMAARVRALVYIPDSLDPNLSLDEFFERWRRNTSRWDPEPEDARQSYDEYQLYACEQSSIVANKEDREAIAAAIVKFPNLDGFRIMCNPGYPDTAEFRRLPLRDYFVDEQEMGIPWNEWPTIRASPCQQLGIAPMRGMCEPLDFMIGSTTEAEEMAGQQLKQLQLRWVSWRVFGDGISGLPCSDIDGDNSSDNSSDSSNDSSKDNAGDISGSVPRVFGHPGTSLRRVELYISTGFDGGCPLTLGREVKQCRGRMQEGHLRRFLQRQPRLAELVVVFDSVGVDWGRQVDRCVYPATLADLVAANHAWPCLRKLELEDVECDGAGLVSLLERHQGRLESIKLSSIRLVGMGRASLEEFLNRCFDGKYEVGDVEEFWPND